MADEFQAEPPRLGSAEDSRPVEGSEDNPFRLPERGSTLYDRLTIGTILASIVGFGISVIQHISYPPSWYFDWGGWHPKYSEMGEALSNIAAMISLVGLAVSLFCILRTRGGACLYWVALLLAGCLFVCATTTIGPFCL
jgi:hypothetical protein